MKLMHRLVPLCLLAACSEEITVPATEVLVSVNSDLKVGTELTRVELKLTSVDDPNDIADQRSFWLTDDEPAVGKVRVPFSFGIVKSKAQRFRLEVSGFGVSKSGGPEHETVRQRVIAGFQRQQSLLIKVFLSGACFEQLCDDHGGVEATCYSEARNDVAAGQCGPVPSLAGESIAPGKPAGELWPQDGGLDATLVEDASVEDASSDAAVEASASDASRPDASPPMPVSLNVAIREDHDDATWIFTNNEEQERLHYDDRADGAGKHIEVANDRERGRMALRFPLDIPKGAIIQSAQLELQRFRNKEQAYAADWAPASATMKVRVFESPKLPVFDPSHRHPPEQHGAVWSREIGGYRVGAFDEIIVSPDLSVLVQHVVDKSDWGSGSVVAFLLSNESIPSTDYADFTDSSFGSAPPRLRVTYLPPTQN